MSANPEAFDFLRRAAYTHVREHGKDQSDLLRFCNSSILEWIQKGGSDLDEAEGLRISAAVARWVFKKYNPPRRKALRSREQRAAEEVAVTFLYEETAKLYGHNSVRKAADLGDKSKTTVARQLRQQGIAPRRQAKIDKLPALEGRLVAILDATFPRDGAGVVLLDELAAALWDKEVSRPGKPRPAIARSTKSVRRKKLAQHLSNVSRYGIGFHLITIGDVVAIRRGRRFRDQKEVLIWIEDEKKRGFRGIDLSDVDAAEPTGFWDDPWLDCVLSALELPLLSFIDDANKLEPLVRLTHPLIDTRPLYPWFWRAINSYRHGDFHDILGILAEKIIDPQLRRAVMDLASAIGIIRNWAQYDEPVMYFRRADDVIKFMARLRGLAPDSYARCGYLRDVIFVDFKKQVKASYEQDDDTKLILNPCWEVLRYCRRLRDQERSGEWTAPSCKELAYYHPDNEAPF